MMNTSDMAARLDFIRSAERLKNVLRSGFTSSGRAESTPEHTWRLCLLVMVFQDSLPELNFERVLKLCVVHDLGEALHGDVPAVHQTCASQKAGNERADLLELLAPLPAHLQQEFVELWDEYEAGASPEAAAVKAFDKIETIIQHNQGNNPAHFDYAFNLGYGSKYTSATPLLREIRKLIDLDTRQRMAHQPRR